MGTTWVEHVKISTCLLVCVMLQNEVDIYDPQDVHLCESYLFKFYSSNFNEASNYKVFLIIARVNFYPVG